MSWFEGDNCFLIEPDYHDIGPGYHDTDYREEMRILNCTGRYVQVRHRNTLITSHPPKEYRGLDRGIYVIKDIYCRNGAVYGNYEQLSFNNFTVEEQSRYSSLNSGENFILNEAKHTRLTYRYRVEELEGKDGAYCGKLDLVFSFNTEPERIPNHPASMEKLFDGMIVHDPEVNGKLGSILKLTIIDNKNLFGDRYLNVDGMILEIKARTDYRYKDGIYLVRSNYLETDNNGNFTNRVDAPSGDYYSFEDVSEGKLPITLWTTKQDAFSKGDKARELHYEAELADKKRALKELESSLAIMKASNDVIKEDYERERIAREKEFEEEKRRLEAEKMRRADYYDDLSHNRKESSEFLKFIPIILGGLALFSKL